ncbi:hypothetical protein K8Z61_11975 [Nocardioides sp. TRM66260-LWL]|uniref:alpha/beta hydrolase family esterase n=1 Tax=Nocardioides sp. TRM66260-LWL TaxID=2874478 RepID=UPI001CC44637|nr:PHB depolymerase family esterase [Nocardioides sp. TRM66260-LWL]MBZ5735214.1 hypothetical protein [Nocardioides sp. TRM66260-LWL]
MASHGPRAEHDPLPLPPSPRERSRTRLRVIPLLLAAVLVFLLTDVLVDVTDRPAHAASFRSGTTTHRLDVDGLHRSYRLYRPDASAAPRPLVVVLHPGFGDAAQAERDYGWDAVARRAGLLVAYPDGYRGSWNAGTCCGPAAERPVDDVVFVRAVVDDVAAHVPLDRGRVHAVGFSNGAMLAERLACATDLLAGVAEVAGLRVVASCAPPAPVSVLYVHGTADANVPWSGGPGTGPAAVAGQPRAASLDDWRRVDAPCGAVRRTSDAGVERSTTRCAGGRRVDAVLLDGAGHQYPGARRRPLVERTLGLPPPSRAIDATAEIWAFLAAVPARSPR